MKSSLLLADAGEVLSPAEVTRVLGIGRNATYELLMSGKLQSIRVTPRRIVVTKRALEAFLGLSAKAGEANEGAKARKVVRLGRGLRKKGAHR